MSVQISKAIDIPELELTDTLTDSLTDTQLTPQTDVNAISCSNQELEGISAKLTNIDSQGCVCPLSVETVTGEADTQKVAQSEPTLAEEETITDLAGILEACDSREALQEICQTSGFTPVLLNQACKRLSAEKHAQIKTWVEQSPLRIGDRVNWSNCPAHCENLAPFEITAIEGDYAKLDLFEQLVPLAELERVIQS